MKKRKDIDISFIQEPSAKKQLQLMTPARMQKFIKAPIGTSEGLLYEKFTYERIIGLPYRELFTLIREGKINIEQTQFIVSVDGEYLSEEEVNRMLTRIEQEIVRDEYKAHKTEVIKLEHKYGKSLWNVDPYLPFRCPWMMPDAGNKTPKQIEIAEGLNHRLDKKTRFIDVYNFLDSKIVKTGEELFPDKWEDANGRLKPYAIIRVNQDFYEEAINKLSIGNKPIGQKSIQKYIKAFCDLNILILLQEGRRWQDSLYAIGYWTEYGYEKYRVIRFLTKGNPGIKALLEFKI